MAKAKKQTAKNEKVNGAIFSDNEIVRADGTIIDMTKADLTLTLSLGEYVDNPNHQDPAGEYYNAGIRILLENVLSTLYSGLKYNASQVQYHLGKVQSIEQVHVERQEQDMLQDDPRFVDHVERLQVFDNRRDAILGNIQEVQSVYMTVFGCNLTSYTEWQENRANLRKPAPTSTGTVDKKRSASAIDYLSQRSTRSDAPDGLDEGNMAIISA